MTIFCGHLWMQSDDAPVGSLPVQWVITKSIRKLDEVRVAQALQGPSAGSAGPMTHKTHRGEKFIYFNIQTVLIEEVVAMVSRRINRLIDFYSMLRASGGVVHFNLILLMQGRRNSFASFLQDRCFILTHHRAADEAGEAGG